MEKYVQSLKCNKCDKQIGEKAPIIESKVMKGVYLTVCPHCKSQLMTAGQQLIGIPQESDAISTELNRELAVGLNNFALKKLEEANMPMVMKHLLGDVLHAIGDKIEEEQANEKIQENSLEASTDEEEFEMNMNEYATKYVVLKDGDVIDEYAENSKPKDIFKHIVDEFGIDALVKGECTLHELKEIKPKFKKKISYELDI